MGEGATSTIVLTDENVAIGTKVFNLKALSRLGLGALWQKRLQFVLMES